MSDEASPTGAARLRDLPDFRYLVSALAASTAGDWLYGVALIVFVFEETGSPSWVAAAGIMRLLPYILLGSVGGVIADRYDRRKVMIATDLARAGVMFALAAVSALSGPALLALLLAFCSTAAGTPYGPAVSTSIPELVGEENLARANALVSVVDHTALIVGPAIGGILLLLGPPEIAFAVNGASFALSALLVRAIRSPSPAAEEPEDEPGMRQRVIEGVRAIGSSAEITVVVALVAAASLVYGIQIVVLVLVSEQRLGTGAEGVAFLTTFLGVGGVVAAAFSTRLAERAGSLLTMVGAALGFSLPLAALALVRTPLLAYALLIVSGAGSIILDVTSVTVLQRALSKSLAARVFGILDSIAVAAILVGSLLAPAVIAWAGLNAALVVGGLVVPLSVLFFAPPLRNTIRAAGTRFAELRPRVEFLATVPLFAGASRAALEAIAASATEVWVGKGDNVVEEGGEADYFYVISSGSMEVLSSLPKARTERSVRTLGATDYFGEIGLLKQIPRTATVRAAEDSKVLRISGEDFVAAVDQSASLSASLLNGMIGRLAVTHPKRRSRARTGG